MTMAPVPARGRSEAAWLWLIAPVLGMVAGLVYCTVFAVGTPLGSAVRGAAIATPIVFYERGLLVPRWRNWIRRASTPLFAAATMLTYGAFITLANVAAGAFLHHALGFEDSMHAAMVMTRSGLAYAFAASAVVIFVFRVRDLIGPSVFTNFILGVYHRPIREERIFLFLDVAGSTAFADRHGDLAAQAYLGRIFDALALPVRRSGGSIDDYVGDLALVTWTMRRGLRDAACLRCVFDFEQALARDAETWRARFGQVPRFRAALHCGSVVTAEVGLERRKIAYFGDVVNTTARLEALTRTLDAPVLISADLRDRLDPIPAEFVLDERGSHAIRGRDEPLAVVAVRAGSAAPSAVLTRRPSSEGSTRPAPRPEAAIVSRS